MSKSVAKGALRTVKHQIKGYTEIQTKVSNATSSDPCAPSGILMDEISQATFDETSFLEVMSIIDKRLNDHGKNWRHVFKSLTLLEYLVHCGSDQVVNYAKGNLHVVKTLRMFQHIDDHGRDQGANVRQKAKVLTALLCDEERLRQVRRQRKYQPTDSYPLDDTPIASGSSRNYRIEESRDTQEDDRDEDDELRRAIEASKQTAEEENRRREMSIDDDSYKVLIVSQPESRNKVAPTGSHSNQELSLQPQGISSSAMALFGGMPDNNKISTPNGYERSYTTTTTTTTTGTNNPFGLLNPPVNNFQQPTLAIQDSGVGLLGIDNGVQIPREYSGGTFNSSTSYQGSVSGDMGFQTINTPTGAITPINSSGSFSPMSGGNAANPFTYNGSVNSMESTAVAFPPNYPTSNLNYNASPSPSIGINSGYHQGGLHSQTSPAGATNIGSLIDIGAPSSGQSFGQQQSKNPFR